MKLEILKTFSFSKIFLKFFFYNLYIDFSVMNTSKDNDNNDNVSQEEPKEPSIYSDDPNERKLARRLRIQKRLAEAARLQAISDGTYVEPEPEKTPLEQQIEDSEDVIENLLLEGKELVSNVKVASDAREVERRENEAEDRSKRLEVLEEEAEAALQKLNEITSRWEIIQDINDPLNLHQHMQEQKAKCLDLIQQKNDLIKNFQAELKLADEQYMKNRKKMYEDLSLLTQRIDEQVLVMKRAYRLELKNIEDVIDSTRTQLTTEHQKTWQSLYDQREKNETMNMAKKFKMVETHEDELSELHKNHEEKYRETRIRLETDIQTLEQELERVKALCLLNSEKLDYNYQVLKKREEENLYIKNHQKRKLNKLQDTVNTLKKKIDEKQNDTESELKRLIHDVQRYHHNLVEIEKKSEQFAQINEDTYQNIWDMKDQEARENLDKILSIDQIIHEQILGIPWIEPETKLFEKRDLSSYVTAEKAVKNLSVQTDEIDHGIDLGEEGMSESKKAEYEEGHRNVLKQILETIADQSGFLVEEKLDQLLKPYTFGEKTLVRLDNVFTAIGIQTEKDMDIMKNVFLSYSVCPICESNRPSDSSLGPDATSEKTHEDSFHTTSRSELELGLSKMIYDSSAPSLFDSAKTDSTNKNEAPDPMLLLHKEEETKEKPFKCNITHPLMIEKIYVLNALKDFVTRFHTGKCGVPTGMAVRLQKQRNTISRLLDKDDVEKYWKRFKEIFPEEHEKLWDAIFVGLTKYHALLQERHKLNIKAQKLRQQNSELRRLLEKYVTKTADSKLFLPHLTKSERNVIEMENLRDIIAKLKV